MADTMSQNANSTRQYLPDNALSIQRRLHTPIIFKYSWFHYAICFISTGMFFILNMVLFVVLNPLCQKSSNSLYAGFISTIRVPNSYDWSKARFVYYLDGSYLKMMLWPAVTMVLIGLVMLGIRWFFYGSYVKSEIKKTYKNA